MKRGKSITVIVGLLAALLLPLAPTASALTPESAIAPLQVTYAGASTKQTPTYIPFNDANLDPKSKFEVNFFTESRTQWPEPAKKAFLRATQIWSYLFESSVTITIDAYWSPLDRGILGNARPGGPKGGGYFKDFSGAPEKNLWYPAALANSLSNNKNDLDELNAEITARFNSNSSNVNWYYGIDGKNAVGQFDFLSAVLHELGHGLGIISTETFNDRFGTFANESPSIFAGFVANESGRRLSDLSATLPEFSTFVTSPLYWVGAQGISANNGVKPKLFAPSQYKSGSSVSHLDDELFPKSAVNGLMSSTIDMQQAIHDPGPVVIGMLKDMRGKTPATRISEIRNLHTISGNKSITLSFDPPEEAIRQEITSYQIKVYPGNQIITVDKSPVTIPKLSAGFPYYFGVIATSNGFQSKETISSVVVPEDTWANKVLDANSDAQFTASTIYRGKQTLIYTDSKSGHLVMNQFDGKVWKRQIVDGDSTKSGKRNSNLSGRLSVCKTNPGKKEKLHIFYTDTVEKDLLHANYDGKKWSYETVDGNGPVIQDYREAIRTKTASNVNVSNACASTTQGLQVFYRDDSQGILLGATQVKSGWSYEIVDGDKITGGRTEGDVAFHLAAVSTGKKIHLLYDSVLAAPEKKPIQGDIRYATRSTVSPQDWQFTTVEAGKRELPVAGFDLGLAVDGSAIRAIWYASSSATISKADRIHWTDLTSPGSISEFVPTSSLVSPISLNGASAIYGCEDRLCALDLVAKKSTLVNDAAIDKSNSISWIKIKSRDYALVNVNGKATLLTKPIS